jgi:hypothetical protein
MSRCAQKLVAALLQYSTALLFLIISADAWSMTVSPHPPNFGNYTVSWSTTLGCTWADDPPFYSEYCYSLQENGVDVAGSGNSLPVTGKPPGSYQYQVYERISVYGQPYDEYPVEGPVAVQVVEESPSPLVEAGEYATRHGDVDGDGDIDIYVKRVAGTSWRLPVSELLLRRNANGTFNVETTVSQATRNIVNGWSISITQPKLVDFNGDGYLDLYIKGLSLANASPYDVVVFASDGPNHVLINVTKEGHIFNPGQVKRSVVVDENGFVKIVTEGTGTGPYKGLNEAIGPFVFKSVDDNVRERVDAMIGP